MSTLMTPNRVIWPKWSLVTISSCSRIMILKDFINKEEYSWLSNDEHNCSLTQPNDKAHLLSITQLPGEVLLGLLKLYIQGLLLCLKKRKQT